MKANELMIGDWIKDMKAPTPCKVAGITPKGNIQIEDWTGKPKSIDAAYIEPLKINADMLDHSGFSLTSVDVTTKFPNGARIWMWEDTESTVYVSENGVIWWLEIESAFYADKIEMAIDCVHELQHALKLEKIDIEIIL